MTVKEEKIEVGSAAKASFWAFFGYGSGNILRLISNLILTRLLIPEYFGIMALVNSLIVGLNLMSDMGIGRSIIYSKHGRDIRYLSTAWTIQIIRGVVGWGILLFLTPFAAQFYQEEKLLYIFPIASLPFLFSGFISVRFQLLERDLSLKRVEIINLSCQILGLMVCVIWAFISPSVWALVMGALAGTSLRIVLSFLACPGPRIGIGWDKIFSRKIISFGGWILVSSGMTFFGHQADKLICPVYFSFEFLAFYSIASVLSDFPNMLHNRITSSILFPYLSRLQDNITTMNRTLLRYKSLVLPCFFWVGTVIVICGAEIVNVMYDDRYQVAGDLISILGLQTPFVAIVSISGAVFLSIGQTRICAVIQIARVCSIVPFLIFSGLKSLPMGIAYASVGSSIFQSFIVIFYYTQIGIRFRLELVMLCLFAIFSVLMCQMKVQIFQELLSLGPVAVIFSSMALLAILWGVTGFILMKRANLCIRSLVAKMT